MKRTIKKWQIIVNPVTVIYSMCCLGFTVWILSDASVSLMGKLLFLAVIIGGYYFVIESYVFSYLLVLQMETCLGINFDEEMAKRNVTEFYYKDYDWYIVRYFIIMNRNFIVDIGVPERHLGTRGQYSGQRNVTYIVPLVCKNGKQIKFKDESQWGLKSWYDKEKKRYFY